MDKHRKKIIEGNQISRLYTFSLGTIPQKVLIEGKCREFPVVITLHGGPGTPVPFSVGCRGLFPAFTDNFIMVYWDQLGCGINDYIIADKFTIESYIEMTVDLIKEVKKLFPQNKLLLFGMSWGSLLSLHAMNRVPELLDGAVVWGQLVKNLFFHEEVYEALRCSKIPEKKYKRLKEIDKNQIQPEDLKLMTACIRKYTDGYQNRKGASAPVAAIMKGLLTSPDYRLLDVKAIMVNGCAKSELLWPELLKIDLTEALKSVSKPYCMLQGDTDIVTSTKVVKKILESSDNKKLSLKVIKNSGHIPGKEGMEAVLAALYELSEEVKKNQRDEKECQK